MSLLNDVLKDLDARQAVAAGDKPLPSAVRPLPALRKSRRPWGVAALFAVVLVAAAAFYALRPSVPDVAPAAVPVVTAVPVPTAVAVPGTPAASDQNVSSTPPVLSVAVSSEASMVATAAPAVSEDAVLGAPAAAMNVAPAGDAPARVVASGSGTAAPVPKAGAATPVNTPSAVAERSGRSPAPAVELRADAAPTTVHSAAGRDKMDRVEKLRAVAPEEKAAKPEKQVKAAIERSDANGVGERIDADYRKAVNALNQGRVVEGIEGLRGVLRADPLQRAARQLLVKLLIEAGRSDEAIDVLRDGLRVQPAQIGWAMALARLQLDRGDLAAAWTTLDVSLPAAGNSADYQGFAGNVLQRLGRTREAIARFQAATRLAPGDGRWWLGLGLAHDAEGETDAARTAFLNARQSANLTPELQALVERKLRQ